MNNRKLWNPLISGIIVFVILSGCVFLTSPGVTAGAEEIVGIEEQWKGNYSGYTAPSHMVIETEDQWREVWEQVHRFRRPRPELPGLDFEEKMVVAVFMGQRSSGGYRIEITQITEKKKEIVVDVVQKEPPPGSIRTMALTQPYHMVVIKKSRLSVSFKYL